MTDTVVAEGQVKFRDGKKWKTRWVVLRKPSPVADCLSLLVYKEKKKRKEKSSCQKERLNVTLEGICGVEPGPGYDGVSYSLSILCLVHTLVLGFSSCDALLAWDARIRYSLGEAHRFSVNVEPGTKLESGSASLHLCNNLLVLSRGLPPLVVGHWKLSALRRYGAVPNGFVFEGGTRCGYWAGVFFLSCSEGEQISFLFDCIVRGVAPSRAPHGLRPNLPADPSVDPTSAEQRISLETCELEKRLSMLSQCSLASSTASTYSCSTSVAADDHSSISSSSSSQSDTSYGSRLLSYWVEPLARQHLSSEAASSSSTLTAPTGLDDLLYATVTGGSAGRPSSAQLHPRGLHDSGRQSSLDSGIGTAAGSQASYSGSFSSCTGSLDTASQGGAEEFGSVGSLPAAPSAPPSAPPPTPPSSPVHPNPDHTSSRTSSSCSCASRSDSQASRRHSAEYKIPALLQLWYDTPRSLLQALTLRDPPAHRAAPEPEGQRWSRSLTGARAQRQAAMQRSHSWGSERAPSVDSERRSTPTPLLLPGGLSHGESQCPHGADNYITPEQWRSARSRCWFQAESSSPSRPSTSADTAASFLGPMEDNSVSGDAGWKPEGHNRSLSSPPPSAPPPLPPPPPLPHSVTVSVPSPTSACGVFQPPLVDSPRCDSSINYVNIPFGLLRAQSGELLHPQVVLQESRAAPGSSAVRESCAGSARVDVPATATVQRGAGVEQGRRSTEDERVSQRAASATPVTPWRPT